MLVVAAPLALARIGGQDAPYEAPAAAPPGLFTPMPGRSAGDPSKADPTPSASPRASSAAPASRGERSVLPSPSAPAGSADPTPSAPTPSVLAGGAPTTGQIVGASGMCVDNMNNLTSHGNPITMAPCNDTGAQRWSFHQDGTLQVHRMCMGPAGNGASSPVQLRRCGRGPGPAWQFRPNGAVVHVRSGLCLHDRSGSGGPVAPNGAPQLTITACTGTAGQRWTYR